MGVTGKGNASKEELASRIVLLYPSLKGVSFDVTDAVAVALCTSNIFTV
jgi:Holliday junction resolvasome RuvABC endonuclease subunit